MKIGRFFLCSFSDGVFSIILYDDDDDDDENEN